MNTERTEEQWDRLCGTARKLIDAPASVVAEDPENFLEMVRITTKALEQTKPRVGRGELLVELGLKCADIRDHPERYKTLSGGVESRHAGSAGGQRRDTNVCDKLTYSSAGPSLSTSEASGSSVPPAQNLQDAEVGGMLCPECAGLEVHNDNCSLKIASAETDSEQPTVPGEAVQSGALAVGRRDPHAPAISTEVVDDDDAPW